jgi:hypothetical protein
MSWESFVKRFMEAQRMMGSVSPQDDFDLMRFLEFSLDDLALKAYESVWPSCTSFVQLVEQIEVRIASREDPSCAAQKITMLKKSNEEGWMEFSMKVQDLFVKAYPGVAPDLIQGMAGEKFFGFYPALWRDKAWMLDVPHDLASMVKFAKKLTREDEYRTQEKDPHAEKDKEVTAGDSKKTNPEGEKKGNKSNNRNDKGQFGKKFPDKNTGDSQSADPSPDGDSKTGNAQTNKPTGRNGAPLSCYNCKKTGHFKRDCTVWCRDKQCPPDHHLVRNCPVLIKYYEEKMKQMPPPFKATPPVVPVTTTTNTVTVAPARDRPDLADPIPGLEGLLQDTTTLNSYRNQVNRIFAKNTTTQERDEARVERGTIGPTITMRVEVEGIRVAKALIDCG